VNNNGEIIGWASALAEEPRYGGNRWLTSSDCTSSSSLIL
jgi:hypothetical protein